MSSGKVLAGVLAGAALGATLGILFAPGKGSSTRKKISEIKSQYAEELEVRFNGIVDSITRKFESVKKEAANMAENAQLKADETKK
jgi:gas vesicle protein